MTSNKWEEFKRANSSNLKLKNSGKLDKKKDFVITLAGDWSREASMGKLTINGADLKTIAKEYNDFDSDDDVENFFRKKILGDFEGGEDAKNAAIAYLKQTFHQKGLMYPVSNTLHKELGERKVGGISQADLDKTINIETTENGFKIQEIALLKRMVPGELLEKFAKQEEEYMPSVISSDKKDHALIQAQGVVDVDFSSDASNPTLSIESNQMNINHAKLSSHLDSRSFLQILVDFLKSISNSNNVQGISRGGMASAEKNEEVTTLAPSI